MKEKKYCIRCNSNDWKQTWRGFGVRYKCKKCGYIFDWLDYIELIETQQIKANQITVTKLDTSTISAIKLPKY